MPDFYNDANIASAMVREFHVFGYTATSARTLGFRHAKDYEHLWIAAQRQSTLVTHDRDFIQLHNAWRYWSAAWQISVQHAGILIIPDRWTAPQAAIAIRTFLQTNPFLINEAYEWRPSGQWVKR